MGCRRSLPHSMRDCLELQILDSKANAYLHASNGLFVATLGSQVVLPATSWFQLLDLTCTIPITAARAHSYYY